MDLFKRNNLPDFIQSNGSSQNSGPSSNSTVVNESQMGIAKNIKNNFSQGTIQSQHVQASNHSTWIRELVSADEQLEKSVMIDMNLGLDTQRILVNESIQFLLGLKTDFAEAAAQFNELKPSVLGRIKVYGIAKTHADFMLFRNGYKMIFSLKSAGVISMRFHYVGQMAIPQPQSKESTTIVMEEELFEAKWGAFEEVQWFYKNLPFKPAYLVRHYLTTFIKESSR